jgi:hypothetical protein
MFQAMSDEKLDPEAERAIARVRWLMLIASVTTFVMIGAVLFVIGYRVFHSRGSAPAAPDVSLTLPAGAKVLSSSIGEGRLAVTIAVAGSVEVRVFDLATLKPVGAIKLETKP